MEYLISLKRFCLGLEPGAGTVKLLWARLGWSLKAACPNNPVLRWKTGLKPMKSGCKSWKQHPGTSESKHFSVLQTQKVQTPDTLGLQAHCTPLRLGREPFPLNTTLISTPPPAFAASHLLPSNKSDTFKRSSVFFPVLLFPRRVACKNK